MSATVVWPSETVKTTAAMTSGSTGIRDIQGARSIMRRGLDTKTRPCATASILNSIATLNGEGGMKAILGCALLVGALAISGCATKRYPIAASFSAAESAAMDCKAVQLELIRAEQIQAQIANTANPDWRSAAGFLGDFGIGNAMARADADKAVMARIIALRSAQADKRCLN